MSFRSRWRLRLLAPAVLLAGVARGADEPLTIETYLQVVQRSHAASRAARALQESGDAERRRARLLADPTLEVTFGRGRATEGGASRGAETGFSLTQSLPWLPARSASIEAAERLAEARRAEADRLRWNLASDGRSVYYRLQEARALLGVAATAERDARSLFELVERRAEAGEAREVDRIKARVEWLRQRREGRELERGAAAAEAALRTLAGEPLPRPVVLSSEPARASGSDLSTEALRSALEKGPELAGARAEAARSQAFLSEARRSRVPDLGLSLFGQREIDKDAYGLSLGVVLPLWNARRGETARASAEASLRAAEAEALRTALLVQLEDRRRDVEVATAQLATLETDLGPAAAESLRLARLLFEEGETSLLDLLDAQRTARETQRELIRGRYALAQAVNELHRLLGPAAEGRASR